LRVDELLDILDESGRPTGEVLAKSEAHRLGLWHRCFHCWICGSDAAGPYLLLQRRAAAKDTWPGYLDITAAGHLSAGEETFDGLREIEEELGLKVDPERLVPLGTIRIEQQLPAGYDREVHEVFLLRDDTPPEYLRLQKEEVESIYRLDLDDINALYETGTAPALEYKQGKTSATRIHLKELVPKNEDHLAQIADASRQLLSGNPPPPPF
jgi:isopentenyldiphosphate isomerase